MTAPVDNEWSSRNPANICKNEEPHQEKASLSLSKPAAKKREVGFDCQFVERPPKAFQVDCPVCLLVLREPHQVTCCGYSFCRPCIELIESGKKSCPTCKTAEFSLFRNLGLQRAIYELPVHCSHKNEGCQWTGELGELDNHLNENPMLGRQFIGCDFADVACNDCDKSFQRQSFKDHQLEQHPFSCEYCHDYESYYEDVVRNHWPVCGFYPVSCPNECGVYPEHQNLEHHVSKDCPIAVVNCDFHYAGCEVQLPRKDMPAHLAENLVLHMTQLATFTQKKDQQIAQLTEDLEENRCRIIQLERENKALLKLQEENQSSLQALQSYTTTLPVEVTMKEFQKHRQEGDDWYSEPFYTHPHGYKMRLKVSANGSGSGKGTHVSVYGCLMRGKFDDHLSWPFRGDITVKLINQVHDNNHHVCLLFSTAPWADASRVTSREENLDGFGESEFLLHNDLGYDPAKNCQFLKEDCLRFQVTHVANIGGTVTKKQFLAIESRVCVPPFEFTMRDFELQKVNNNRWFSPSFYTHPQGYRMCLKVCASSYGTGRGTDVSVYVHLRTGEWDNYLKWPFRGEITIQLLNQIEDRDHFEKKCDFTDTAPDLIATRTIVEERIWGWGFHKFISHRALSYDPEKNCQYLRYDCLRFRITKVKLKK